MKVEGYVHVVNMVSGITARHGLLSTKNVFFHTIQSKALPLGTCIPRSTEVTCLRAATNSTGDSQHNDKYCVDVVRLVGQNIYLTGYLAHS